MHLPDGRRHRTRCGRLLLRLDMGRLVGPNLGRLLLQGRTRRRSHLTMGTAVVVKSGHVGGAAANQMTDMLRDRVIRCEVSLPGGASVKQQVGQSLAEILDVTYMATSPSTHWNQFWGHHLLKTSGQDVGLFPSTRSIAGTASSGPRTRMIFERGAFAWTMLSTRLNQIVVSSVAGKFAASCPLM